MPVNHRPPRRDKETSGSSMAAGIGAVLLMIACCAVPLLVVGGALAGIGGLLGNPWLIAAAVVLVAAAIAVVVHCRRSGRDVCCLPTGSTKNAAERESPHAPPTRKVPASRDDFPAPPHRPRTCRSRHGRGRRRHGLRHRGHYGK